MKKIAIYYRVSTDKQDLRSQKEVVETWLKTLSPKPEKVFRIADKAVSGATEERKGYRKLMRMAEKGKIDTIVVYRLDRFSRRASTAIRTIMDLDDLGVGFVAVDQPVLNLGNDVPFRKVILAIFAELAELERDVFISRVKAGIASARKRGVKFGAPVKLGNDVAKKVRKHRSLGKSYRWIAEDMSMSVSSVHRLAKGTE